ncbi:GNAT family N-acetyltransferase [Undibacterium fentianense]|uniref:GNAT family N-acetyltransferase n=1 Tax=Undibacterium fentianense TaxID=2828728 RepID=A0A941E7J6_9BURK|nr:GNAT family N-acetyltransferase [Undibacterium fentianense]MBR7800138.1 GNAT family N-acetyltransferase [Undibacterium fentianense]
MSETMIETLNVAEIPSNSRLSDVVIRPIAEGDNLCIASLIRAVLEEMNVPKVGSAAADPSLDFMYQHYTRDRGAYFVVEYRGDIVAGGGIGSLPGAPEDFCELQKMYMLPSTRGMGIGNALIQRCLDEAKQRGYRQCYLETLPTMLAAQKLYQKMGFTYIDYAIGDTGHSACQVRMLLRFD